MLNCLGDSFSKCNAEDLYMKYMMDIEGKFKPRNKRLNMTMLDKNNVNGRKK